MNQSKHAQVPEICLIAPSQSLADLTRKVAKDCGLKMGIYVAVLDDGLRLAEKLSQRGAKVFVSRKGTAELLVKHHFTVANINTTLNDYLRHLDLLKEHSGHMVIVEYAGFVKELQLLCQYLGVEDTTILGYQNAQEYEVCVETALKSNASCFMGGGASLPSEAMRYGIPYTVVENTYESVTFALDTARQLLAVQNREQEKQREDKIQLQKYITLVNHTHDAIINVDAQGCILIMNTGVQTMLHMTQTAVGRNISSLLPELEFEAFRESPKYEISKIIDIKGQLISVNQIPITINQQFEGGIYFLQTVKSIQKNEQKIRLLLHQKGLVAKYRFEDILGVCSSLENVKLIAKSYARADSSVLIMGETGTGKELFAQSIHNCSRRQHGPFVAVNCAALPKDLLSSQLFGYEEGSFTGAVKGGKAGIFELAHGGTIFLDEIGEIPEETQIQLLRVLQEKEVRRLSSDKVIPIDVRVICATNKDLAKEVKEKRFRMDLFYRINVLKLEIPPLRKRREDIPVLINHFLNTFCDESSLPAVQERITEFYPQMMRYSWPGNIRELLGVTERFAILLDHELHIDIDMQMMLENFKEEEDELTEETNTCKTMMEYQREDILSELRKQHYQKLKTAQALGISRSTLWRLIKKYQIQEE